MTNVNTLTTQNAKARGKSFATNSKNTAQEMRELHSSLVLGDSTKQANADALELLTRYAEGVASMLNVELTTGKREGYKLTAESLDIVKKLRQQVKKGRDDTEAPCRFKLSFTAVSSDNTKAKAAGKAQVHYNVELVSSDDFAEEQAKAEAKAAERAADKASGDAVNKDAVLKAAIDAGEVVPASEAGMTIKCLKDLRAAIPSIVLQHGDVCPDEAMQTLGVLADALGLELA